MGRQGQSGTARRFGFLLLAALVCGVILALPSPAPVDTGQGSAALSQAGKASLAVLAFAVVLWMSEALPFAVTGLLALVLMVIAGAAPFEKLVADGFGNPIILFFIGVLLFSAAIAETKLLRRVTVLLLYRLGHSPRLIILAFLLVGTLLSGWITDMAVAAMLFPLGVTILEDAGAKPLQSNFGRGLMIACAWGPLIGGISTPAGCGPNPLTIGFLKDMAGVDFSFPQWMAVGYPAALLMVPMAWLLLLKVFPPEPLDARLSRDEFLARRAALGPVERKEVATLVVFALLVFLWVSQPMLAAWSQGALGFLSISFVAIACACLLFLPGVDVISWATAEKKVSWGGVLLIVTGLAMGKAMAATGAAEWTAWVAFRWLAGLPSFLVIFFVVLGVSLLKVMFSSNTVTGIIIVPLLIALAGPLQMDPVLLAIPAGITSSLAFILVTSTPTNVIPYAAGYFSIADMAKAGVWMTLLSSLAVTLSVYFVGGWLGLVQV